MAHRGPDQSATQVLAGLDGGLAVRRLALVDLEGGDQPQANEDGSILALLNGEIYNHAELRRELAERGHRFRSRSDTEVLVHLYEQVGDRFLERLEGMFALAIFDLGRRRLLLARDGAGMKPLYHTRTAAGFVFASEAKALFASGLAVPRPDAEGLDAYLAAGFVPAPRTAFAGVDKLAAGTFAVVDASGVRLDTFWRFAFRTDVPPLSDREYVDELERRLTAAVESHLRADVPIGAYLSGGWDSSLVTALAARRSPSRMQTFSIVFPGKPDADESRHSRHVAAWLGTEHREVEFRAEMLPDLLPRLVRHLDEPVSAVPAALDLVLASLAGAHVKGVVGGEGADELFGGYRWFRSPWPYALRSLLPRPLARLGARFAPDERVQRWMRIAAAPDARAADGEWRRFLTVAEKRELLKPEFRSDGPDLAPLRIPDELDATCRDSMQRRLANDIHGRLADGILFTHDKTAMAHSLEVRVPFLDRGVVELAERLPSRLKMHRGREKVVVRRLAERLLPPEIAARRKQGLAFPAGVWFDPPAGERLRQLVLDTCDRGPFERRPLERHLARNPKLPTANSSIATVVMLQIWWNEFL